MGRKVRVSRRKGANEPAPYFSNENELPTGIKRKKWSSHDLINLKAKTINQADFLEGWFAGRNVCGYGTAGTGKTLLALYAALSSMFDEREGITNIRIVRSAVTSRDVGHLPGTLAEKQSPYEVPYVSALSFLIGRESTYDDMKAAGKINFTLTSHVRGDTWHNTVVIVDEAQNMTFHELDSVITRLGHKSRLIIVGDVRQTDLMKSRNDVEGFTRAIQVFGNMPDVSIIKFTPDDVVRSGFVKQWILACEDTP